MAAQPMQHFAPNEMWGMDWIGPITPACSITGAAYILLVIDYCTRFVWAKAYRYHTSEEVRHMFEEYIAPIFGWSRGVYLDSASHFVNELIRRMFENHGLSHFKGPVSHSSSTGLLERGVQEMMAFLSKKCIDRGTNAGWSLLSGEGSLEMNTKAV